MSKFKIGLIAALLVIVFIGLPLFFNVTPAGKALWNNWFHSVQVADDNTNYDTRQTVEDTCRSMIATYEADKLSYEQYVGSDDKEERSWAAQAKMRANRTAATYNNYILKNNYVWKNDVPRDIVMELPYIE
jgi:hypothetical protein